MNNRGDGHRGKGRARKNQSKSPPPKGKYFVSILLVFFILSNGLWIGSMRVGLVKVFAPYEQVSPAEIEGALANEVTRGFLVLSLQRMQEGLLQLPWVRGVVIQRRWPNILEVTLQEHQPVAQWDKEHLVASDGVLFSPSAKSIPTYLPKFHFPREKFWQGLGYYRSALELLAPFNLYPEGVIYHSDHYWELIFRDLVVYFNDPVNSEAGSGWETAEGSTVGPLAELSSIYNRLTKEFALGKKPQIIDLRYRYGVAVKW